MSEESSAIARRWGKWSQAGVPHLGWTCDSEYDAKEDHGDMVVCGMCETTEVRFVHVMSHPDYPDELHCGCICAGHMSGEKKEAEDRERRMRSRAQRRSNFRKRKGWKIAKSGTPYISVDNFHMMIATKANGEFQVGAKHVSEGQHLWGKKRFSSLDDAKTGCFDALEYLQEQRALKRVMR